MSFAEEMVARLAKLGRGRPELIAAGNEDAESFGNATVTVELDGLRLHFIRDRGTTTVEIGLKVGNPTDPSVHPALRGFVDGQGQPTCPLELVAAVLDDVDTDVGTLAKYYEFNTTDRRYGESPPPGPFLDLDDSLKFLKAHWQGVSKASSDHDLQRKAGIVQTELLVRFERHLTSA